MCCGGTHLHAIGSLDRTAGVVQLHGQTDDRVLHEHELIHVRLYDLPNF